ncbi:sn-glycerol-3-phosphate ABC transporter permease UgpA [soil metagenome]
MTAIREQLSAAKGARVSDTPKWKEAGLAALFLSPSIVVFVIFFYYPFEQLIVRGLYRNNIAGDNLRYVGWSQYGDVLGGEEFRSGIYNSFLFLVYTVPVGLLLGILLAILANRRLRGMKVFQTIFTSTVATSTAVAGFIFLALINPTIGVIKSPDLLANPDTAMIGVALASTWQTLGVSFVIVLAGLQAIPKEVEEASQLDGHSALRRFFTVTLPLISPVLLFLLIYLVINAIQAFAIIDALTQPAGGPDGSTETIVFKIFENRTPDRLGEGSIMSVGLFVVTFVVTLAQFAILEKRVHYGE